MSPGDPIRVLIVDDHPIWRDAVARDLSEEGFAVVGTAADAASALRILGATRPDVVLCDLSLPDRSGVEVIRAVAAGGSARALVLSASGEGRDVLDAVKAGAIGYLTKSARPQELSAAVFRAAAGEAVYSPGLAALVLGEYRRMDAAAADPGRTAPAGNAPSSGVPQLTGREEEVLRMVGAGRTAQQVAQQLGLSPRTVQNHIQHAMDKLQVHNRAQLVRYTIEHGLD